MNLSLFETQELGSTTEPKRIESRHTMSPSPTPELETASTPETFEKTRETTHNPPRQGTRRVPLTAEQRELAAKFVPMAKSLAKPLKMSWPNEGAEFESAALMALVEAAQSFDPSRNVKFATFARYRIWGAIRDVQRGLIVAGWKDDLENAPRVQSFFHDAEEHGRVLGTVHDAPVGQELEAVEFVESWLRKLPPRHAAACREIYIEGKTQGEAAETIGCSKSRLSYIHKEALELINDAWAYQDRTKSLSKDGFKTAKTRPS
jgi:RNA polymerase sigma factor (sigma-70 family)